MNKKRLMIVGLLASLGALLLVAVPVGAQIKVIAPFYILDDTSRTYEQNIVDVYLGGNPDGETHVLHEIGLDTNLYDPEDGSTTQEVCDKIEQLGIDGDPSWVQDCPASPPSGSAGEFAGVLSLGLAHGKDAGGGISATLFIESEDWTLIDCDLDDDGDFDGDDLAVDSLNWDGITPGTDPADPLEPWASDSDFFKVLAIDTLESCDSATCDSEIVTTLWFDLDTNGDDVIGSSDGLPITPTAQLKSGRVCFFARVYPDLYESGDPVWPDPGQARIDAGGGDKTVNIQTFGPTAIALQHLIAESPAGALLVIWLSVFILLAATAFFLIRMRRRGQASSLPHEEP